MARRKCVILWDWSGEIRIVPGETHGTHLGRDRVDRMPAFNAFKAFLEENGVEITGCVKYHGAVFGWVERERIPEIRTLPGVATINDDYPYLVQDLG